MVNAASNSDIEQALALLVSRRSTDSKRKTTLIVAPVALLRQWKLEIEQKINPEHQLSVYLHHGPCKKFKTFKDMAKHDGKSVKSPQPKIL